VDVPVEAARRSEFKDLEALAVRARVEMVRSIAHARGGHLGGPLSAADLLIGLYFRVLRIRPSEPDWDDRDRFVLSKGHSSIALYVTMALRGYFPVQELLTFDALDSRLQGHPDMNRLPGLDMSTGSLGLGVSAAVGIALGAKLDRRAFHVYTMLGDGECQEGIVWEAADIAARYRLDNLTAIVDVNGLQQYGWPGVEAGERQAPFSLDALEARWRAFGWKVAIADGHDFASIFKAFDALHAADDVPRVILAKTVKGKGVPFMEGKFAWHAKVPSDSELKAALEALEAGLPQ
jgi:transketolase